MSDPNNSGNSPSTPPNQASPQVPTPSNNWTITSVPGNQTWIVPVTTNQWIGVPFVIPQTMPFEEPEATPEKKADKNGCVCVRCQTFNEYAEPNQDDGTFMCYACRKGL